MYRYSLEQLYKTARERSVNIRPSALRIRIRMRMCRCEDAIFIHFDITWTDAQSQSARQQTDRLRLSLERYVSVSLISCFQYIT